MPEDQIDLHQFIKHKEGKFLDYEMFRTYVSTLSGEKKECNNILLMAGWFINPPDSHPSIAGKKEFKLWLQYSGKIMEELQLKKSLREQSIYLSEQDAFRLGELLMRQKGGQK